LSGAFSISLSFRHADYFSPDNTPFRRRSPAISMAISRFFTPPPPPPSSLAFRDTLHFADFAAAAARA